MHEALRAMVTIDTQGNEEKMRIGTAIHEQLRGNPDYVNNNIVLNVDEDSRIRLWLLKDSSSIPEITIKL